jgi:hypothetical protein
MHKTIYIVTLYSSGERWHSYVCASPDAVMRAMSREGYTPCVSYLNQSLPDLSWGDYWEFENPRDLSQTAIAMAQRLVE